MNRLTDQSFHPKRTILTIFPFNNQTSQLTVLNQMIIVLHLLYQYKKFMTAMNEPPNSLTVLPSDSTLGDVYAAERILKSNRRQRKL